MKNTQSENWQKIREKLDQPFNVLTHPDFADGGEKKYEELLSAYADAVKTKKGERELIGPVKIAYDRLLPHLKRKNEWWHKTAPARARKYAQQPMFTQAEIECARREARIAETAEAIEVALRRTLRAGMCHDTVVSSDTTSETH